MKKMLYLVSAAAMMLACAPEHKEQEVQSAGEEKHGHVASEEKMSIELNEGKKWKVNSEMMVPVEKMESEIRSFQGASLEEYKALAEKIKSHIAELTSACTMTGRSHEELHKWLHPLIELSEKFGSADSAASAQKYYEEIKKQMEVFHQYFE